MALFKEYKIVNKDIVRARRSFVDHPANKKSKRRKKKVIDQEVTISSMPSFQPPIIIREPIPQVTLLGTPTVVPLPSKDKGIALLISDDS